MKTTGRVTGAGLVGLSITKVKGTDGRVVKQDRMTKKTATRAKSNNIDTMLKKAAEPARPVGYWRRFPKRVTNELASRRRTKATELSR